MPRHKSWKAKAGLRKAPSPARELLRLETIFERKTAAQIYEDLIARYRGDVPVKEIWNHLADRRQTTISTSGAGLIARG